MDFKPGTKCFAKVKGYSPWPARIDVLPDDVKVPKGKYPIFFYGSHEVAYVTAKDIYDFEKYRSAYGIYKERNSKFNDAMLEIDSNPTVYQLGFDQRAVSFLSQFYKFNHNQFLENSNLTTETDEIDKRKPLKILPAPKRKRPHSTQSNSTNNKDQIEPIVKSIKLELRQKKESIEFKNEEERPLNVTELEKSEQSSDKKVEVSLILKDVLSDIVTLRHGAELKSITVKESETSTKVIDNNNPENSVFCKKENFNIILNSFKSPIKASNPKRIRRSSAMQTFFKQNFVCFKNLLANQRHGTKKSDMSSRTKKDGDRVKKNEQKHVSTVEEKTAIKSEAIDKQNSPKQRKVSSSDESQTPSTPGINPTYSLINKDENSLRIVSKLSIIDKEIKRNLVVGQENYEKCLAMMQSLLDMNNIPLVLLCRVPEIIVTIRKCRRYKKDESIKSDAFRIFQNFLQAYEHAQLEEKIEAGAELLKRDLSNCKSAQMLLDELFAVDKIPTVRNQKSVAIVLSSPSSAQSFHSSADNTPLLNADLSSNDQPDTAPLLLDPDHVNINELIRKGVLELIESYSFNDSKPLSSVNCQTKKIDSSLSSSTTAVVETESNQVKPFIDYMEIYKELGV